MAVNAPTARDIRNRMWVNILGQLTAITDLTPIATLRQIFESMIVEFSSLWAGLTQADRDWYLQTAAANNSLAAIRRRLADYPIPNLPTAQAAYGNVTVTVSAATDVQPGAIVRTNPTDGSAPQRYQVQRNLSPDANQGDAGDGTWHVTASRDIPVICLQAGTVGNTSADTIVVADNPITNLTTLTNASAFTNGTDEPNASDLWAFFKSWLLALRQNSGAGVLFAVANFTDLATGRRVHSAAIQEWDGTVLLNAAGRPVTSIITVDEGLGAANTGEPTADPSLIAAVQALLDGSDSQDNPGARDGGLPTAVVAARALVVDVAVQLDLALGTSPDVAIQQALAAINAYFGSVPVSGTTVTGEQQGQILFDYLFRAVADVPGVLRPRFAFPTSDIAVPLGYKAVLGQLTSITTTVVA